MYTHAFRRASNRASWTWSAVLTDPTTGTPISLTGATLSIAISDPDSGAARVTGSTSDGRVVVTSAANGQFTVTFPRSAMVELEAQHYDVGLTVTLASGITHQLVIATLPVLNGGVAA